MGGALLVNSDAALVSNSGRVEDVVYLIPLEGPIVVREATQTAEISIAMDLTLGVTLGCEEILCVATIIPGLLAPQLSFD